MLCARDRVSRALKQEPSRKGEDALGQLDADGKDRERDDDAGELERELVRVVTCNATSSSV